MRIVLSQIIFNMIFDTIVLSQNLLSSSSSSLWTITATTENNITFKSDTYYIYQLSYSNKLIFYKHIHLLLDWYLMWIDDDNVFSFKQFSLHVFPCMKMDIFLKKKTWLFCISKAFVGTAGQSIQMRYLLV